MDAYDSGKARRVWQRVQAAQPPSEPQAELDGLIAGAQTAKATYLRLAQQGLTAEAPVLKKLAEKKQAQAACLNGMRVLSAGHRHTAPLPPARKEPPMTVLRRCRASEVRALREYELRIADRDHGPVWAELAAEQRQLCRTLLELIGRMEG